MAATRGPEGQACDFTNLRVYTWNRKKTRYETAFIENNLCGALPIRVEKNAKGDPEFRFKLMDRKSEERTYRLIQTMVRRVRQNEGGAKAATAGKKSK